MPLEDEPAIAGVLLAAGASLRMGRSKLFLEIAGESLLRRAAGAALGAGLVPVVVVIGHEAERARGELAGLRVATVENVAYARGVGGSLRLGIGALAASVPAAVILLADMPLVSADMIAEVVARHRASGAPLVTSDYGGIRAPPTLYARSLFAEILALGDGAVGKQVAERHANESERVAFAPAALRDIDCPEDYQAARAEIEGGGELRADG